MAVQPTMTRQRYWRRQLTRILVLLAIWALCGIVMSILFVEQLNAFSIGGVPFGFWMAQQGSIYVFVIIIFVFAYLAGRDDRAAGVDETSESTSGPGAAH